MSNQVRQLIDRPSCVGIRNLDRMVAELSRWMTPFEIDQAVSLLETWATRVGDHNLSAGDSGYQLRLLFGTSRYEELISRWAERNSHLITVGVTRWFNPTSGRVSEVEPVESSGWIKQVI